MQFVSVSFTHLLPDMDFDRLILEFFEQVGNVYVQFREEEHAANALRNLSGRFYAG